MKKIKWVDKHIEIEIPTKTKKITGTRFATILGLNPWSTPFEMWCAITKTYEKPFEDTIYTIAGKTIEPKQAEYIKESYGLNLISPTDQYGENYFNKTYGDFFADNAHYGGMWDYLGVNENGKVDTVFEMKTTKRIEDWKENVPEYYSLQAALYGYLLGVDNIVMVASFLMPSDYENPSDYKPSIDNTITIEFKISEKYPDFKEKIKQTEKWWKNYISTGISPDFDEEKDAEILKALRTKSVDTTSKDIANIIDEAETIKKEIDDVENTIKDKSNRLKVLTDNIKNYAINHFGDGDKKVEIKGNIYNFSVSKTISKPKVIYDDAQMKTDGVFDKYVTFKENTPTYRLTIK